MSPSVIVYSPNEIRVKIIVNTLKLSGIETIQFANHFEIEEAVRIYSPSILILDIAKSLQNEVNFLRKIVEQLPGLSIVVLLKKSDVALLRGMALNIELCASDPLDPESILLKVREILLLLRRKNFSIKNVFFILNDAMV